MAGGGGGGGDPLSGQYGGVGVQSWRSLSWG